MNGSIIQELIKDGSMNEWREEIKKEMISNVSKDEIMNRMKEYMLNNPLEIDTSNTRKTTTQLLMVFNKQMKQDIEKVFEEKIKEQATIKILQTILKDGDIVPNGKIDNGIIYIQDKIYDPNSDGWNLLIQREGQNIKLKNLL